MQKPCKDLIETNIKTSIRCCKDLHFLLVVVVLAIAFVFTRKSSAESSFSNRDVVAFENPLYNEAEPGIDAAGGHISSASAGLYDEPSVMAQQSGKANPLYDDAGSGGSGDEESGYLDVDAADDEDDEESDGY